MTNLIKGCILSLTLCFTSCQSSQDLISPLSEQLPTINDNYTLLWVGSGESYIFMDGQYQRTPSNDYTFEVVQRRYNNNWKSTKNLHRIHPEYKGKAGPREQHMYFELDFLEKEEKIISQLQSSLGNGQGQSDREFREQTLEFKLDNISSFAPYNTMRITQDYDYENGVLNETVELFKLKNQQETPFIKIEETAYMFRPTQFKQAPTTFQ